MKQFEQVIIYAHLGVMSLPCTDVSGVPRAVQERMGLLHAGPRSPLWVTSASSNASQYSSIHPSTALPSEDLLASLPLSCLQY